MYLRLPNLAPLAGQCQSTELVFTTDVNGTVLIAPADPMRWAVIVSTKFAGYNVVTTKPGVAVDFGVRIPPDAPLVLTYSQYLNWVQQDLYYQTDNPVHKVQVLIIRSNPGG